MTEEAREKLIATAERMERLSKELVAACEKMLGDKKDETTCVVYARVSPHGDGAKVSRFLHQGPAKLWGVCGLKENAFRFPRHEAEEMVQTLLGQLDGNPTLYSLHVEEVVD